MPLAMRERGWGEGLEHYDAVKLFAERARRLRHDFDPTDHRADLIRICQLTEGMPLALELAAGWLKALSCAEIANEIQRGLDFLAADVRDVPERHRSMAAAFAQSWHMLTDAEQKIFRRMSVFRGGFTRETAEKITGATLHTLAALLDKSFLRVNSEGRYDVHELLRQYGEAKLEAAGEIEAIRDAHSAYYLDFLAQRDADIKGRRQVAALDEIEADFDNVRTAWYRAIEQRNDTGIGHAVETLTLYCDRRSRFIEHDELFCHAHERFAPAPGEKPPLVWAQLMARRAALFVFNTFSDEKRALAQSLYEKSRDVTLLYDNRFETAYVTFRRGDLLSRIGSPDALKLLEESLLTFQALEDEHYISDCWFWISGCYGNINANEQSYGYMRQCADLKLKIGDKSVAGWAHRHLSSIHYVQGQFLEAEQTLQQAIDLFHEVGNPYAIGEIKGIRAIRAYFKGDLEDAYAYACEASNIVLRYSVNCVPIEEILGRIECIFEENYPQSLSRSKNLYTGDFRFMNYLELMAFCGLGDYEQARQRLPPTLKPSAATMINQTTAASGLTIAAIIFANQSEQERAVEIFGLVFAQPIEWIGWLKRWGLVTRLLARLQSDLGDQVYSAAWERGKNFDLETTFADIAAEFSVSQDTLVQKPLDSLTPREREVLPLLAAGLSNAQIAERLVISVGTAKTHVHNILGKLGVENRAQAIARIHERGLS